ncbi:hypothetical protein T06_10261 [Trichinella sp. T6]|nr:hypothetical protein T06_1407 [Trichinella sp. T6]KRX31881.1 hypothetical protein T06_10261 [Trichinella sp. T6]
MAIGEPSGICSRLAGQLVSTTNCLLARLNLNFHKYRFS